jgi:hypothetical protein
VLSSVTTALFTKLSPTDKALVLKPATPKVATPAKTTAKTTTKAKAASPPVTPVSTALLITRLPSADRVGLGVLLKPPTKTTAKVSTATAAKTDPAATKAPATVATESGQVSSLQKAVSSSLTKYDADMKALKQDQADLAQQQKRPQGATDIHQTSFGSTQTAQDSLTVQAQQQLVAKDAAELIVHETSYVLSLVHPDNPASDAAVVEIVTAYKTQFQQEAVLRLRSTVCAFL